MPIFLLLLSIVLLGWASWEMFHCSFHIAKDLSLLSLPGVKLMMLRKLCVLIGVIALVFYFNRRRGFKNGKN